MTVLESVLLGLLQGIAEFLPISSSGHLALAQYFFDLSEESYMLFFDVLLHLSTLTAIFIVYRKDVSEILKDMKKLFSKSSRLEISVSSPRRLAFLIVIATIPLVLVVFFNKYIELLMKSPLFIGFALIATGVILKLSDRKLKGKKNERSAYVSDVVFVGIMQAIATLPGVSRSGMTITSGLFRGFDRKFAVKFSFLMSIPAILGATILETVDAIKTGIDFSLFPIMLLGMTVAAITGYFSIKLVNRLIVTSKFGYFSYYCVTIGAVAIFVYAIKG